MQAATSTRSLLMCSVYAQAKAQGRRQDCQVACPEELVLEQVCSCWPRFWVFVQALAHHLPQSLHSSGLTQSADCPDAFSFAQSVHCFERTSEGWFCDKENCRLDCASLWFVDLRAVGTALLLRVASKSAWSAQSHYCPPPPPPSPPLSRRPFFADVCAPLKSC